METIVIRTKSKSNAKLLAQLAEKLGDKVFHSIEEAEDMLLLEQMNKNRKTPLLLEDEKKDFLKELGNEV